MLKTGNLVIGGVSIDQYGAVVNSSGIYAKPKRDYEMVHIPGRNGDLHIDNGGWQNVDVTYTVVFPANGESFTERYNRLFNALMAQTGYLRIEDDFDVEHFRMGVLSDISNIKTGSDANGICKIKLDCKPQRFLKSGDDGVVAELGEHYWTEDLVTTAHFELIEQEYQRPNTKFTFRQYIQLTVTTGGAGTLTFRAFRKNGTYVDKVVTFDSAVTDQIVVVEEEQWYSSWRPTWYAELAQNSERGFQNYFRIYVDPNIVSVGYTTEGSSDTFNARVLSAKFKNITSFASKPLYRVSGYGYIKVGGETVTINGTESLELVLDAETKNATYADTGEPANNMISGEIPDLPPGEVGVLAENTVESMLITPRWYEI